MVGSRAVKGSVRRRGEKWLVTVDLGRDEYGRRVRKFATEDTEAAADARLIEMLYALQHGTYTDPSALTFGAWLAAWLDDYAALNVTPKTLERYREIARLHVTPALGDVPLQKLTTSQLQRYYRGKLDGLANATVRQHRAIVHAALRQAVAERLLSLNPDDAVKLKTPRRAEMTTLSAEQGRALLAQMQAKGSPFYVPTMLALSTGMRRGEIVALRWRDVDLKRATVKVRRSVEQTDHGTLRVKETKTASGTREVPLPVTAVAALKAHRTRQKRQRLEVGDLWRENDLVWPAWDGEMRKPDSLSSGFSNFVRRTAKDVPAIGFHGLRHTYASMLAAAGRSPRDIAAMLGHASPAFTMATYAHVLPGSAEVIGQAVERELFG